MGNIGVGKWKNVDNGAKSGIIQAGRKSLLTKEEVIEKAKSLAESKEYESANSFQEIRSITNAKLGYDGLPKVVNPTEFNKITEGKTVLYRGVQAAGGKTASEIVNEFKYGELWTGNSGGAIFGNGVYFTGDESIAKGYAFAGRVFEAVLDDGAKVADYKTIFQEFLGTGIPKIIGNPKEDYQFIIRDVGQYAAIKGYDAIALNGFQGHDYIVLLNRTKIKVKE